MQANSTIARRRFLTSLTSLLTVTAFAPGKLAADETKPAIAIRFSLDRPINAGAAPVVMAAADGDLSIRLWPALARRNGIKSASVTQSHLGAAVREPMLSAGQVDAVTGFSYLSAVNLRDRGVPADDLAVLRYADYGCEAYGFAVIVNPAFAAARPGAVKGLLRALISGTQLAIREPKRTADVDAGRMGDGSPDIELERLHSVIADNIITAEVRRDGIGGIDPARLEARSIKLPRISSSSSGRQRRIFSTTASCRLPPNA